MTARMATRGIIILGALAAGGVATVSNVRWALAVGGAIEVLAAVLIWRALARSRITPEGR